MLGTIIIAIVIVGAIVYGIRTFVPIDPKFKSLAIWVIVIVFIFWLVKVSGVIEYLNTIG